MNTKIVTTLLLMLLFVSAISAQIHVQGREREPGNAFTRVDAPPVYTNRLVLGKTATAGFNVLWKGTVPDSVKECVLKAVDIWSHLLTTTQTINIEVEYVSKQKPGGGNDSSNLASASPKHYKNNFAGGISGMQYPLALARQMNSGFSATDTDIVMSINSNIKWYKGLDGLPKANQQDLISTVLHEIGHGLGISGSMHVSGGTGSYGISGYQNSPASTYYTRYDYFGYSIGSKLINRANPSSLLGSFLTNGSVFFDGPNAFTAAKDSMPKLYAPNSWSGGSSFSHLDEDKYPAGNPNSLMTPKGKDAEVIWTPGEIGLAMLQDLGWNVNRMIVFQNPLAAQEIIRGSTVTIKWYDNTLSPGTVDLKLWKQLPGLNPVLIPPPIGSKLSQSGFNNTFTWNVPANLEAANYFITAEGAAATAYGTTNIFKITNTVPMPAFSPAGGQYNVPTGQTLPVQLLTNVEGGVIRFTTNGSEPTKHSQQYISGQPIYLSATTTIKAKTYLSFIGGSTDSSATATAPFTINHNSFIAYIQCVAGTVHKTSSGNGGEDPNSLRIGITNNGTTRRAFIKVPIAAIQSEIPSNAVIESVDPILNFSPWNIIKDGNVSATFKEITYDANALTTYNNIGNSTIVLTTLPANSTTFNIPSLVPKIQGIVNGTVNSLTIGVQNSDESNHVNEIYSNAPPITLRIYYRGNVEVSQVDKNNNQYGNVQLWNGTVWENKGSSFTQFRSPSQPTITLKGEQTVKAGTTEKYQVWLHNGSPEVVNHNTFSVINGQTNTYISQFAEADNSVIIRNTIDGINAGNVEFKDPWYIDYNDGAYGVRNRGMANAYPHSRSVSTNGFKPDGTTNYPEGKYSGVFLSQTFASGKYYTVNSLAPSGYTSTFLGWSVTSGQAEFQNENSLQTGVVFKQANTTITANYKASLASNSAAAFANNSARKVVKTTDGYYHLVYESMGGIWYEKLSESGVAIAIKQIASVGKNPAVAAVNPAWVVIVYQAQSQGTINRLTMLSLSTSTYQVLAETQVKTEIPTPYTDNLNPSVTMTIANGVCVVWEEEAVGINVGGIYYRLGIYNSDTPGFTWTTSEGNSPIAATSSGSKTPEVQWNGSAGSLAFHLVWEQAYSEHSDIRYCTVTYSSGTTMFASTQSIISQYYGANFNQKPSLIGVAGGGARVCWIGYEDEYAPVVTIFRDPSYGSAWYFGETVSNTSINKADNGYVIGWSENGTQYYADNTAFYTLGTISSNGADLQVVNSASRSTMRAIGFTTTTSPHRFTISNHIGSEGQQKSTQITANRSRGGIIVINGTGIGFSFGDVTANGEGISFAAIPESLVCNSIDQFNSYLVSEPFILKNNSNFTFGVHTWVSDSVKLRMLPDDMSVRFSVELINAKTGEVIGVLERIKYKNAGFTARRRDGYKVDTKGIGGSTVRVRITAHTDGESQFALTSGVARSSAVGLRKDENNYKTVGYKGIEAVTTYALDQNYPNPFNPSTTISYALPQDGVVTVKIYDALGREVTTLVNEFKQTGRYTASFDASRLSSGVYIYKLVSGEYSSTKKMMLVK